MSQLKGTTMAVVPIEHEVHRRDGDITSFPTTGKFESTSQDTTLDIGREWSEIFEWPEWEDDETFKKDNDYSLLSEHDFRLPFPSSESQRIQPNGNDDVGHTKGTEDIQEEEPTALALDISPQHSNYGEQTDSGMLPEINISDSFAEHLSSTDRDDDDQPAAPSALPSLPLRPTTPRGPPFICMHSTCRRSFNRLAELRRHQRGHAGNRSFFCRFIGCKRASHGFVRKDNLSQHVRRVHQVAA